MLLETNSTNSRRANEIIPSCACDSAGNIAGSALFRRVYLMAENKVCPICKGSGTVPTECPRCFGSGKEEPEHTLYMLRFRDNIAMMVLDSPRNPGLQVRPYESIEFHNIYIGKHVTREFKCTSAWYKSRWGIK